MQRDTSLPNLSALSAPTPGLSQTGPRPTFWGFEIVRKVGFSFQAAPKAIRRPKVFVTIEFEIVGLPPDNRLKLGFLVDSNLTVNRIPYSGKYRVETTAFSAQAWPHMRKLISEDMDRPQLSATLSRILGPQYPDDTVDDIIEKILVDMGMPKAPTSPIGGVVEGWAVYTFRCLVACCRPVMWGATPTPRLPSPFEPSWLLEM